MEYTIYSLFTDLCIMSALLLLAKFLRSKIKWFQNHYIPSSLIAGFLGLLLGEQICNLFQWSSQASSYPYLLICVLFAGIVLGRRAAGNIKKIFKEVGDTFLINTASEILCFAIPLLVGGVSSFCSSQTCSPRSLCCSRRDSPAAMVMRRQ